VIAGIWGATGQSCVAGSRLLIHESIHDAFVAKLAKRAEEIKIGAPLDMATEIGPLATRRQLQRAEKLIAESVAAGATLVTGGKARSGAGYYFEPTILLAPSVELPCVREEFFGPVLSVLKFKDIDEIIEQLEPEVSSSEIFAALFELELSGKVKQLPGKNFVKSF